MFVCLFVCFENSFTFVSNIYNMKKQKAIAPTLKRLNKSEKTEFPLIRYAVVSATCQRLLMTDKLRFSISKVGNQVEVTRIN